MVLNKKGLFGLGALTTIGFIIPGVVLLLASLGGLGLVIGVFRGLTSIPTTILIIIAIFVFLLVFRGIKR